jgi:hypothetical protein
MFNLWWHREWLGVLDLNLRLSIDFVGTHSTKGLPCGEDQHHNYYPGASRGQNESSYCTVYDALRSQ